MIIFSTKLAAVLLFSAVATGSANASAVFDYSYEFNNAKVVSGSFTGTASGNLVTGLSGVTGNLNGIPFVGGGSLTAFRFDNGSSSFEVGGAVASFDGLNNNFLFANDAFTSGSLDPVNLFLFLSSMSACGNPTCAAFQSPGDEFSDFPANVKLWSLTAASSVPEPASLALVGVALLGVFANRRAKKHVIPNLQ